MSGGKRKQQAGDFDSGPPELRDFNGGPAELGEFTGGLLELGDVSGDLAVLGSVLDECSELGLDVDGESAPECDYDSVSSPGGSTCSGPTYIRHTGFGPEGSRPLSQLSADGVVSPVLQGPPSPLLNSSSSLLSKPILSRHRLSSDRSLEHAGGNQDGNKKKKGLLRPEFSEFSPDIRGVQVPASKHSSGMKLGTITSTRNKNKKGKH